MLPNHLQVPETEATPLDEAPPPANPVNRTWLFALLLAVGLGLAGWKVLGSSEGGWLHDLDAGIDASEASGKPMFVLYTADWCPPCRELKRTALNDPGVVAFMSNEYVRVKIDLTNRSGPNVRIASDYGVSGIPAMILYDRRGVEIDRVTGGGAIAGWLWRNAVY